ncbi:MAG: TPM domain-containing protein [Peptococcaceae bacterium]|jgi:uncharacterized protein|nr:TPM domain-containing protein [Peptococcaceae bacterium]
MKRVNQVLSTVLLAAFLTALILPYAAFAADKARIVDEMGLLSDAELAELNDYAEMISRTRQMDVAFLLADHRYAARQSLSEYTSDYYDRIGLNPDGFMLAYDEVENDWILIFSGSAGDILTEDAVYDFFDAFDVERTYVGGIEAYLDTVDAWFALGGGNSSGNTLRNPSEPYEWLRRVPPGERLPRFVDDEGLLTAEQAATLTAKLDEISQRHQFDVVIVTVYSLEGWEARLYAVDFLEQNGFGYGKDNDSAILLLATEDRDFGFATLGYGIEVFTPAGQDYLDKLFLPQLRVNDYFGAFMAFADASDDFLIKAKTGSSYDDDNIPLTATERSDLHRNTIIGSLVVALLAAFIVTGRWKSQLKSVRKEYMANVYIRDGSMVLTDQQDIFLHKHVSQSRRASESSSSSSGGSSFSSSSGSSASGHSGKY